MSGKEDRERYKDRDFRGLYERGKERIADEESRGERRGTEDRRGSQEVCHSYNFDY